MQSNKKNDYDTRTFPEIYASLNHLQQMELRDEVLYRLGVSRPAFWAWTRGTIQQMRITRTIISDCIKKVLHITAPQHTLYDIRKP